MKRLYIFCLCAVLAVAAMAQTKKTATKRPAAKPKQESREVRGLRSQQQTVKKKIRENEIQLATAKQDEQQKQKQVDYLEKQLADRVAHIRRLEARIDSIDGAMTRLTAELDSAAHALDSKRGRYAQAVRYARSQRSPGSTLWFIISADTWQQRLRRARYARQFADHQQVLGRQIIEQQRQMHVKQGQLLTYKSEMAHLLKDISWQRSQLVKQHRDQQQVLGGLKEKQKGLAAEIENQRKQLAALDKKIDEVIAREIEAARKAAEEAARRKAAAEEAARRKAAAEGKPTTGQKPSTQKAGQKKKGDSAFTTTADKKLTGSFEQNKGRLPVPITGEFRIAGRMGAYTPTKGVTLDNKGIDYVGRPGCCARSIFDGTVTAVFAYAGMTNVLVRHGSYISVYCNLSSVRIHQGQQIKARDLIGTVATSADGEPVLHFQLRRETTRLNPEEWISK